MPSNFILITFWSSESCRHDFEYQKWTIWVYTALHGQDQLRQRVAWAFYQILVLAADQFDTWTEHHLVFYDIFVRNAFGNFRDVLKEVSFSPMMALSLSFLESKSRPYVYETTGKFLVCIIYLHL